jgi:hypothetical protein
VDVHSFNFSERGDVDGEICNYRYLFAS